LIVNYLLIFDDMAAALEFDDQSVKQVVSNIQELQDKLPEAMPVADLPDQPTGTPTSRSTALTRSGSR